MGTMVSPEIATREEWRSRRLTVLAREKELSRLPDELSRERRGLPWIMVFVIRGDRIAGITGLPRRPDLFARLGLPPELAAGEGAD